MHVLAPALHACNVCTHNNMYVTCLSHVHVCEFVFPDSMIGYGFVDFENPADAQNAVASLQAEGILAQFAKLPQVKYSC